MHAAGERQRHGANGILARPGQVVLLRDTRQQGAELRIGAQVRQQAIPHPTAHLLPVDRDEADPLAGRQRGSRGPIPLGPAARQQADVPLDARMLRRELVVHGLHRGDRGRVPSASDENGDRLGRAGVRGRGGPIRRRETGADERCEATRGDEAGTDAQHLSP
jgi:hypothetical protein